MAFEIDSKTVSLPVFYHLHKAIMDIGLNGRKIHHVFSERMASTLLRGELATGRNGHLERSGLP